MKDKKIAEAVFRLQLIQDALLESGHGKKITPLLKKVSSQKHLHPSKGEVRVSLSTLFRYMCRYKTSGIEGLVDKPRNDKGKMRKIGQRAIDLAIQLRKDNPQRTTEKILKILKHEYAIIDVKRSTLDHYLDLRGYSRKRLGSYANKIHMRFESKQPNDLWIGDYHDRNHMFALNNGKMAHLNAFIDCHSRYITHGQYYLSENIQTLEDTLKKAILKCGIPKRIYVDNARVYHSHRFAYCCEKLGIKLLFSKAYVKESRGKVEKFFGYVKLNFESEVLHRGGCDTLEELNKLYWAWLEEDYHKRVHTQIETTPHERYHHQDRKPKPVDITLLDELFMLTSTRMVDPKTSTVAVMGKKFQTEAFLAKRKVEVHYNPNNLSFVIIYYKGQFIHRARVQQINKKIAQPLSGWDQDKDANLQYDYLAALEGRYRQHLGRHRLDIEPVADKNKQTATVYGFTDFINDINQVLSYTLSKDQKQTCLDFYNAYSPFSAKTCMDGLTYAGEKLGNRGYAINVFLDYLKIFIFNQRKK